MKKATLFLLIAAIGLHTACSTTPKVEKVDIPAGAFTVEPFTRLEVTGRIDLTFVQTSGTPRVVYSTAVATSRHIDVNSEAGTLSVASVRADNLPDDTRLAVTVYAPAPTSVALTGVGNVTLGDLTVSDDLQLNVAGPGDMRCGTVKTPKLTASLTGAGDLHIERVEADDVDYSVTGAGDLSTTTIDGQTLTCNLAGAGDLDLNTVSATTFTARLIGPGDLTARQLRAKQVDASLLGAGDLSLSGIRATTLTADLLGAGDVSLSGSAKNARLSLKGAGTLDARNLDAKNLTTEKKDCVGELLLP